MAGRMETDPFRVIDFATARAQELTLLREQIKSLGGKKQLFQSLPWHLRRRTMSHQTSRMPRKWRNKTQPIDNRPSIGKNKCRKYRRKVKYLRENLKRRLSRQDRLETHLWFVKRFHMKPYFGYQVPWCSVDRKQRSAYRAMRDRVVVYDASFVDWILLEDTQQNIVSALRNMLKKDQQLVVDQPEFLLGRAVLHTVVEHRQEEDTVESTTLQVIWAPRDVLNDSDSCKVLVCMQFFGCQQARDVFISTIFHNETRRKPLVMNRFHVIGPKSLEMIRRCFQIKQEDWNVKEESTSCGTIEKKSHGTFTCLHPLNIQSCCIPKGFHIGFPHFCISSQTYGGHHWLEDVEQWTIREPTMSNWPKEDWQIPVVLVNRPLVYDNGKRVDRMDILIPSGFGSGFLHAARHMGAQALGLKEYRRILFECEKLHFPEDFPQTGFYKDITMMTASENLETILKKPPAKRGTNKFPFSVFPPRWNQLGKTPEEASLVWESMNNKMSQLANQYKYDKTVSLMHHLKTCSDWSEDITWKEPIFTSTSPNGLFPVFIQVIGRGNISSYTPFFLPGQQDVALFSRTLKSRQELERKLIGYITYTSYSFAHGCVCCVGYCVCEYLSRGEWQPIIIPRTTECTKFIPAKCRKLKSQFPVDL